ncbi:MAG: FAD binding domain-containing protein [Gemmatimonadota bacterium]
MKPAPFEYHAPDTLEQAVALLGEYGFGAKLLAGGQSLIPTMNFRLAQPAVLIDLNGIEDLAYVREDGEAGLRVGAMTRQRAVERSALVAARAPLLFETMPWIAHPQIRNRGTIGGSIAHADPAAELPAVMLALEADLALRGPSGTRTVPASEFFTGLFGTAMAPDEILTDARIPPLPGRSGAAFLEIARRHGDYALAGVAAVLSLDGDGRCNRARVALFSVSDGPVLSAAAAGALEGRAPDPDAVREAAKATAADLDPPTDIHASAAYRRHLARHLTERALRTAAERAAAAGA